MFLGRGDGRFSATPIRYRSGSFDQRLAHAKLADFDGDGNLDVLTTSVQVKVGEDAYTRLRLGNGDGTLRDAPLSLLGATNNPQLAVVDLNHDGHLDIVVGLEHTRIDFLLGHGDGTFEYSAIFTPDTSLSNLAVGDFNNDGHVDLVTRREDVVSVLLGNGDRTFQDPLDSAVGGSGLAVGDFNGDGWLDLALKPDSDNAVRILLNDRNW